MFLRSVHFKPGVVVPFGGAYPESSFWSIEKHPLVLVEECNNGNVILTCTWDGTQHEIERSSVGRKVRAHDQVAETDVAVKAAMVKRREAERAYADKFGAKQPIKGTEAGQVKGTEVRK